MSRRRKRPSESNLALSFIDTISGGFGAAFFLFLIFASMPPEVSNARGGASRFMEFWLTWNSANDLAEITLLHAESGQVLRLTATEFTVDPETGQLTSGKKASLWSDAYANGFSWFGESTMRNTAENKSGSRLRIADPCPGHWTVRATLHSRPAGEDWFAKPQQVKLWATALVFDGVSTYQHLTSTPDPLIEGDTRELRWKENGDQNDFDTIEISTRHKNEKLAHCM